MSDIDVRAYINQLRRALPCVPPIPVEKIKALHARGDLTGIVKLIRSAMNVNVRLVLHWTSEKPPKEIPNAPAWIRMPKRMPYYGTEAFKRVTVDIFIRKEFARKIRYDQFAMAVAHEFSHVVLNSIDHPLREDEKAVDLTAMLLGFSYLYGTGAHTVTPVDRNILWHERLGYLSEREIDAACQILAPQKISILQIAKQNAATLIFLCFVAAVVLIAGAFASGKPH
jgi:hypothetical protein